MVRELCWDWMVTISSAASERIKVYTHALFSVLEQAGEILFVSMNIKLYRHVLLMTPGYILHSFIFCIVFEGSIFMDSFTLK